MTMNTRARVSRVRSDRSYAFSRAVAGRGADCPGLPAAGWRTDRRLGNTGAMTTEQVLVEVAGDLATVTLNRPERRNALSESMLRDLGAAISRAAAAPGVRAIILAAAGPVFSAGHDFTDMIERDLDGMRRL